MARFFYVFLFIFLISPLVSFADVSSSNNDKAYIIGGLGVVDTKISDALDDAGLSNWGYDDGSGSFRLGYGYYLNETFSLEIHYNYATGAEITTPDLQTASYDLTTLGLEGVYEVPISPMIDFIPRLGVSYVYEELYQSYSGTKYGIGEDSYHVTYGAGVQINNQWRLEFYQWGNINNPSLYLLSYRFGL